MKYFFNKYKTVILFILVVSVHFWFFIMHNPMKYYSDSYIYLELSQNMSAHSTYQLTNGVEKIYSFYPPVYSFFISIFHRLFQVDYKISVNWISYLSLVFFIFFFYKITILYFQKKKWQIILTILVTISLYPFFFIALSEHIFLALFMIQMYALIKWEQSRQKKLLFISGVLAGILILTRYASIGITGAELIWLISLMYQRKIKLSNIILFLIPVLLIYGSWHALLIMNNTSTMGRKILLHLPRTEHLKDLLKSFFNWLVPGLTPYFFIPAVAVLDLFSLNTAKNLSNCFNKENIKIWYINFVVYMVFITLIISFLDHSTSYDFRLLIPVYFSFIFIVSKFLEDIFTNTNAYIPKFFAGLILISYLIHFIEFNIYSSPKIYSQLTRITPNNDNTFIPHTDLLRAINDT